MEIAQTGEAVPASSFALSAARAERWLGRMVEVPVALLTALEVLILLAGVISRYVFHRPFTWSDELASILFLWLAMLGAVVAFRRGEHMRMSTLVARASPQWRTFFEAFAVAVAVAFLALVLYPTFEYALDEAAIVTPAMEIPNIWRAAALPVGSALMLLFALLRLARTGGLGQILLALLLIALIGAGLWMLKPMFVAMGNYKLVVFFVALVAAGVLAGAPIAFVFAIATFAFLAITTRIPLTVVVSRMDEGMSHIILLSVPLFVFLGLLIEATGMARAGARASALRHRVVALSRRRSVGRHARLMERCRAYIPDRAARPRAALPDPRRRGRGRRDRDRSLHHRHRLHDRRMPHHDAQL